jgi:hypothetical protein
VWQHEPGQSKLETHGREHVPNSVRYFIELFQVMLSYLLKLSTTIVIAIEELPTVVSISQLWCWACEAEYLNHVSRAWNVVTDKGVRDETGLSRGLEYVSLCHLRFARFQDSH